LDKVVRKFMTLIFGFSVLAMPGLIIPSLCDGQYAYGQGTTAKPSVTDSIKQGFNKAGSYFTPKPSTRTPPTDDAVTLNSKSKPGPELYAAIARLNEESGKYMEAEQYYQMALKENSDNLAVLLGYARFQENQGRLNEALALYQKAIKTHPKDPIVYNNMGLCLSRRGKLNEAATALGQAVQLDPRNPLYRNNLATMLVDQNRLSEAFANLRAVHGDAGAYYNMGYLLNKKGKTDEAERNFAQALLVDPKMAAAQKWLNYLHDNSRGSASGRQTDEVRLGSVPNSQHYPAKIISPAASGANLPPANPAVNPPRNPASAPGRVYSGQATTSRYDPLVPSISNINDNVEPQPDMPPSPPSTNLPKRLPPIPVLQPAGSIDTLPAAPVFDESGNKAPLPPSYR
jgi:tetratricopeptide (TPR) repeat protein